MTNYEDMSKGELIALLNKREAPAVQGDCKVVPVEPTTAMRAVWKRMRGYCWHDKYKAMLAAAPAVQGEPVGWQFYQHGEWCDGDDTIKDHKKTTKEAGFRVRDVYTAPQPAEQQPVPVFSDEDHVSMPRGLIAAACSAVDKKRDAESVLSELRRYTLGDLSRQAEPDVSALVEALEELVDLMEDTRQGEYVPDSFTTQPARTALAAHRKGDEK